MLFSCLGAEVLTEIIEWKAQKGKVTYHISGTILWFLAAYQSFPCRGCERRQLRCLRPLLLWYKTCQANSQWEHKTKRALMVLPKAINGNNSPYISQNHSLFRGHISQLCKSRRELIHMYNEYEYANSIYKPCPIHVTTSQSSLLFFFFTIQ